MPLMSVLFVGTVLIAYKSLCLTFIASFIPFHSPPGFTLISFCGFFFFALCFFLFLFMLLPSVVLYLKRNSRNSLFLSYHLLSLQGGFPARLLPLELQSRYMPLHAHTFSESSCYSGCVCLKIAISNSIRMISVWTQNI